MDIISHALLPYLLGSFFKMDRKLLAAFIIGAVAPDMDVFIIWLALIFPSPNLLLVHRGITHSLIFGSLTALTALLLISRPPGIDIFRRWTGIDFTLSWPVACVAFVGVLMHLFLDYLVTKGVPLLYPYSTTRFSAELLFHYEIVILVFSIGIGLWLIKGFFAKKTVSGKTLNRLLLLFLIVTLAVVGARVEGKENAIALENYEHILGDSKKDFEIFPDWGLFQWIVLEKNKTSFQVYSYNALNNDKTYLASYPQLHIELDSNDSKSSLALESDSYLNADKNTEASTIISMDDPSDLETALNMADSQPKVVLFRWRACAVAVNASLDNGSWTFEYYDPVSRAGMAKDPFWLKELEKRSSPLKVNVEGDQARIIGQDLKDLSNISRKN